MKITTVRYARLRNLRNYENERVELEATVGDDEDPRDVYAALSQESEYLLFPERALKNASGEPAF